MMTSNQYKACRLLRKLSDELADAAQVDWERGYQFNAARYGYRVLPITTLIVVEYANSDIGGDS